MQQFTQDLSLLQYRTSLLLLYDLQFRLDLHSVDLLVELVPHLEHLANIGN
jgi:hypothetical protein